MHDDYLERTLKFGHLRSEVLNLTRKYAGLRLDGSLDVIYHNDQKIVEFYFGEIATAKPLGKTKVVNDLTSKLKEIGFCIVN